MKNITVHFLNSEMVVTGALVQDTVMYALSQCLQHLASDQQRTIDLSHVTTCDSASLAFALALLRAAKQQKCIVKFTHLPDQMRDLARVSGVTALLPLAPD